MKNQPLIIPNSFSLTKACNVKIRIFFIQVFEINFRKIAVCFYKLRIGVGVFKMRMCKNNKRFFHGDMFA